LCSVDWLLDGHRCLNYVWEVGPMHTCGKNIMQRMPLIGYSDCTRYHDR